MNKILRLLIFSVCICIGFFADAYAEENIWEFEGVYYTNIPNDGKDGEPLENEVYVTNNPDTDCIYSGDNITIPPFIILSGKRIPVTGVNALAFRWAEVNSVTLPVSVKVINTGAFAGSDIRQIDMPGVEYLSDKVFSGCENLETLTLPASLTQATRSSFFYMTALKEFVVEEGNTAFSAFDGVLYNYDQTVMIYIPETKKSVRCPETLEEILPYIGNSMLTSIEFPSSLKKIGRSAFEECTKLRSMIIPASVTDIGDFSFRESGLERVEYLTGCDTGEWLFLDCERLSSVTLSDELKSIPKGMFKNCKSLRRIVIPDKVEKICEDAFSNAGIPGGMISVKLGKSVKDISLYAFDKTDILNLICLAEVPPTIYEGGWPSEARYSWGFSSKTKQEGNLYVPDRSVEAYKNAEYWKTFQHIMPLSMSGIQEIPDDGENIIINGNTVTISSGIGTPVNIYSVDGVLIYKGGEGKTQVELPSGLYIVQTGTRTQRIRI